MQPSPLPRFAAVALIAALCLIAACQKAAAQSETPTTMACQFTSGPLSGAAAALPASLTNVPLGTPCTDNAGSHGRIGIAELTTVCGFTSGPMAGTRFDLGRYGVPNLPVGTPCTDNGGSTGTLIPYPEEQPTPNAQ